MKDKELFQKAISMDPWGVVSYEFDPDKGRLDLELDFPPGQTFACPECNTEGCKVYDTEKTKLIFMLGYRGLIAGSVGSNLSGSLGPVLGVDSLCCLKR